MARGGFVQLPDGSVIVALTLPRPVAEDVPDAALPPSLAPSSTGTGPAATPRRRGSETGFPAPRRWSAHADEAHTVRAASARRRPGGVAGVRVLVHSLNRARALTRLRNLGLRAVYLNGNVEPPTPDEVTAVLHHPEGLVWRSTPESRHESWHPIAALLRPAGSATDTRTAWT